MAAFDAPRPRLAARFFKAHGLGNDYLVFEGSADTAAAPGWLADPAGVAAVCDRWRGPGADGIVALLGEQRPFPLRMFNPDGSEFERSGNGLRILAAWLARTGRVGVEPFEVEVGGDRVTMQVHARGADGVYDVSVRMGRARVGAEAVGLALDAPGVRAGESPTVTIALGAAGTVAVLPVSVGNPHAVVFDEPLERARLEAVGSSLAVHAAFAHGTNVQLARVRAPGQLEARVWERGVGWTAASGTSACAVAVAAVSSGRASPGEHRVHMEGGVLRVSVDEALEVTLRGPVQEVCEGELAEGFLAGLAGD